VKFENEIMKIKICKNDRIHITVMKSNIIECTYCGKIFSSKNNMYTHRKNRCPKNPEILINKTIIEEKKKMPLKKLDCETSLNDENFSKLLLLINNQNEQMNKMNRTIIEMQKQILELKNEVNELKNKPQVCTHITNNHNNIENLTNIGSQFTRELCSGNT
jgi:hypothetical protein